MRRPRLTNALDETVAQTIVLNAPAGYGKTTLAQEWLQGRDGVVWYRATPASADLAAFSTGLADVVSPLVPGAGDRLRQRLRVGDPPERAVRPLAELMADDLKDWVDDGLIVVDDYHLVSESTPVEEFVDWLLTLIPLRMLVTTRRRPTWASARRFLYGEVMELGPEQLAMTDEEASQVLGSRPGDAVHALVRQAQGWPALIGLAALSASLELPEERVSDALFRYFAEEVLRQEPPEVQRFMLLASIPATITTRVAREVLGFEEPEPLIDRLRTRDLVYEVPTASQHLRFHPLLRDFLHRKARRDDQSTFQAVSHLVIDEARARRSWEEALQLIQEADQPELALDLVGEATRALLDEGRIEAVDKWLSFCATVSDDVPEVTLAKSELLTWRGRLVEAAIVAEELVSRLPPESFLYSRASYVAGSALHLISEDERAFTYHLCAKQRAQTDRQLKDALWGCFIAAGELESNEAVEFLRELEAIDDPSPDARLRLAAGWIISAQREGSYSGVWRRIQPLIAAAHTSQDPMVRSSFIARAADLCVSRADYASAHALATEALQFCEELGLAFARNLCLLIRGNAEVGLRRLDRARQSLREIKAARVEDPYVHLGMKLILIKLALSEGRRADPVGELDPPGTELQKSGQGEYWALLALSAATHDPEASRMYSIRARGLSRAAEPLFYAAFADLIRAKHENSLRNDQVVDTLRHLLLSSASADTLEPFVLAYRTDPSLLGIAHREPSVAPIAYSALTSANDGILAQKVGVAVDAIGLEPFGPPLTPREQEVLDLIADGLSNADIARTLFITESTTKVHVHHILEKLNVKTRLQAALQARGRQSSG